jgi:hypothetical protein
MVERLCLHCRKFPLSLNARLPWGRCCQGKVRRLNHKTFEELVTKEEKLALSQKILKHQFRIREEAEKQEAKVARRKHQKRPHARRKQAHAPMRQAA